MNGPLSWLVNFHGLYLSHNSSYLVDISAFIEILFPNHIQHSAMLIYDGTYEGFLTTIFFAYKEHKLDHIIRDQSHDGSIMNSNRKIFSEPDKARRVTNGLVKWMGENNAQNLYHGFLSEAPGIEDTLFYLIQKVFAKKENIMREVQDPQVKKINRLISDVNREFDRITSRIRLKEIADRILIAEISPDYNTLPLIANFLVEKYSKQRWFVFDIRRQYAMIHTLDQLHLKEMSEFTYKKWRANPKLYFEGEKSKSFL